LDWLLYTGYGARIGLRHALSSLDWIEGLQSRRLQAWCTWTL